jgi:hypothetical protein
MAYQNNNKSLSSINKKIYSKFWRIAFIEMLTDGSNEKFIEIDPENKTALNLIIEYLEKNNIRYTKANIGNTLFVFGKK